MRSTASTDGEAAPATRRRNAPGEGSLLRAEIVDATARLLDAGAAPLSLSLRAIAAEAGITAPAIYAHFAGVREILAEIVARRFAEFSAAMDGAADALPSPHSARDELLARASAYCAFGLQRRSDYDLMFSQVKAHGVDAYADSAGQRSFDEFVKAVTAVRPDADGFAAAAVLWPALHGLVLARHELPGFPWPPLADQLERLIDGLVMAAPRR